MAAAAPPAAQRTFPVFIAIAALDPVDEVVVELEVLSRVTRLSTEESSVAEGISTTTLSAVVVVVTATVTF